MGTRGLYGIRKGGKDKLAYNHWDSYPTGLGREMIQFVRDAGQASLPLSKIFDNIELVSSDQEPTKEQKSYCKKQGWFNDTVSERSDSDWYCLLYGLQGAPGQYIDIVKSGGTVFMQDNHKFIEDSLFCEYAYIINLDTDMFEYWEGFQREPDPGNRYGQKGYQGYYPCKLKWSIPLSHIRQINDSKIDELASLMEDPQKRESFLFDSD